MHVFRMDHTLLSWPPTGTPQLGDTRLNYNTFNIDTSGFSRLCVKGSWDSKASSAWQGSTWGVLALRGTGFFLAVMEGERSKVYSPYCILTFTVRHPIGTSSEAAYRPPTAH